MAERLKIDVKNGINSINLYKKRDTSSVWLSTSAEIYANLMAKGPHMDEIMSVSQSRCTHIEIAAGR